MKPTMMLYKVKSEKTQEHEQLTSEVFQDLRALSPRGVRCLVLRLPGGCYIHIALFDEGATLFDALDSFRLFQITMLERCVEPPKADEVAVVADYRVFDTSEKTPIDE